MQKTPQKDLNTPHALAMLESIDNALREAAKLAKKRAEATDLSLVFGGMSNRLSLASKVCNNTTTS